MYADVIWDLTTNVSETKYLKYQQNIEGNSSFRMWKCENFLSSLAPLARIFIEFFLNFSVLSVYNVVYSAIPALIVYVCRCIFSHESICFWSARSLRSLAQYMYIFFVGTFGGLAPPPPHNTKRLATLLIPSHKSLEGHTVHPRLISTVNLWRELTLS